MQEYGSRGFLLHCALSSTAIKIKPGTVNSRLCFASHCTRLARLHSTLNPKSSLQTFRRNPLKLEPLTLHPKAFATAATGSLVNSSLIQGLSAFSI